MDRILVANLEDRIKELEADNVRLENKLEESESTIIEEMADLDLKISQATQVAAESKGIQRAVQNALGDRIKRLEREAKFPHLKFGPDAERDYAELSGKHLQLVSNKLVLLNESALEWRVKGGARPKWKCKVTDESDTVKGGQKSSEKRRFKSYHGDTREFMWHARYGNSGRIHLRFDPPYEVEIGYIGKKIGT